MSEIVEATPEKTGFLDTVAARLLALLVAAGVAYLLVLAHQHYSGSPGGLLSGVDKATFEACVSDRMDAFEEVAGRAGYSDQQRSAAEQAARASARAFCAEMTRPAGPQ